MALQNFFNDAIRMARDRGQELSAQRAKESEAKETRLRNVAMKKFGAGRGPGQFGLAGMDRQLSRDVAEKRFGVGTEGFGAAGLQPQLQREIAGKEVGVGTAGGGLAGMTEVRLGKEMAQTGALGTRGLDLEERGQQSLERFRKAGLKSADLKSIGNIIAKVRESFDLTAPTKALPAGSPEGTEAEEISWDEYLGDFMKGLTKQLGATQGERKGKIGFGDMWGE